jgi:hypothetical protein
MLIGITNTEQLHKLRDIYVSRYKYLGIWFNNSGSFNFAQNELYQKALKALFKLKSDFLVHNPEVKTSIHVFDHTIKPILLYGCEIWGYFNPFNSRFRNGNIPIDQIFSKLHCEKLHLKFCKFLLGVHKKAPILQYSQNKAGSLFISIY